MKISEFISDFFPCLVVKFSIYLNRRVFLMADTKIHVYRIEKTTDVLRAYIYMYFISSNVLKTE